MSDKKSTFRELSEAYKAECVWYYNGIPADTDGMNSRAVNAAEKALIDYVEKLESRLVDADNAIDHVTDQRDELKLELAELKDVPLRQRIASLESQLAKAKQHLPLLRYPETDVWIVEMGGVLSQGTTEEEAMEAGHSAVRLLIESMKCREKELRSQRDIGIGIICRAFQPMKFQVRALLAALWEIKNSQGSSVKRIATMAILRNSATAEAKVLEGLGWKRIKARDDRPHDHFYDPLSNRKISASAVYSAFALLLPNSELEREKA